MEGSERSCLSDRAILSHMQKGTVVIEPFVESQLNTSSYDVTLGEFFYRESSPEPGKAIYNFWSKEEVQRVWGSNPCVAEKHLEWCRRTKSQLLENIGEEEKLIWIRPGETILGHTNEFLGGRKVRYRRKR